MPPSKLSDTAEGAPPVDFIALLGRCLGNVKIVERVMAAFRDSAKSDFSQLQVAAGQGDYAAIMEIAHRFKGAASNVSADGLVKLIIQAEVAGRDKNRLELTRILADIQSEMESLISFAEALVPTTIARKLRTVVQIQNISETRDACAGS